MKAYPVLAACLMASAVSFAAEPLDLTFSRSGADAASVSVSTAGPEGVGASLVSVSHSLKQLSNGAIICADVNGKDSPTISFEFSITGLPADYRFNTVGLNIWGLNAAGNHQESGDGIKRQFNVDVAVGGDSFVTFSDLDPAAGVPDAHKLWSATADRTATASSPLNLTITVTKGTANSGCFFGLDGITLSYVEAPETPDVPDVPQGNVYTIKWKNNTDRYIGEDASGALISTDYATTSMIFWEFIPTDNENCFYIRNTASGNYIGSCNFTPSSASKIHTSATPVEYYMGTSAATSGANKGCVWLSSTDCANYSDESKSPRALNKDGASETIITWTAAVGNIGSYWTLVPSEDLYEVRPFTPSAAIGAPEAEYYIINSEGLAYTPAGTWEPVSHADRAQRWYFVGSGNEGGYQIVAVATNTPVSDGARFSIADTNHSAPYSFIDSEGNPFLADITFTLGRSSFAMNNQIYQIPCGSIGNVWIKSLTLGELHYPMATAANGSLSYNAASKPANKYVILSRDAATVYPGESSPLQIELSANPAAGSIIALCIDWNRDGIFESVSELTCAKSVSTTLQVPADAALGKTRARIRLTANGILDPDGDVSGEILDLMLNVANPADEPVDPVVKVNDPQRGSASWAGGVASATPAGNSIFLYWLDGARIVSVEPTYSVEASTTPRVLTAVFSANTLADANGIDRTIFNRANTDASIRFDGSTVSVEGASEVNAIMLFSVSAAQVAETSAEQLSVAAMAPGIYIVKAITPEGIVSAKIRI